MQLKCLAAHQNGWVFKAISGQRTGNDNTIICLIDMSSISSEDSLDNCIRWSETARNPREGEDVNQIQKAIWQITQKVKCFQTGQVLQYMNLTGTSLHAVTFPYLALRFNGPYIFSWTTWCWHFFVGVKKKDKVPPLPVMFHMVKGQ